MATSPWKAGEEHLNELNDKCLSILVLTIKSMEKSKNIDALQLELQMVMEQRIPEIRNIDLLQNIMKHFGKDATGFLKQEFENNVLEKLHCLTSENALCMFNMLAVVNYTSIPILDSCSKKMVATIHGTQFKQLNRILLACCILHYKNVEMFSAIESYVTSFINMWSIEQLILFLSAFEILHFRPTKLLDIVAENVIKYPESLNLKELMIIFRVYSQLSYVPKCQHQQFFEALNCSLSIYLPGIYNASLLQAVYSFCVLGYHPQAALNHLMQKDVLSDLLKPEFEIKLDAERKKVLPVTETDDPADLNVQRVIFLYTSESDFCLDMCPRGTLAMKMRHLKALGYCVILFSHPKFQKLGKKEAVEFLKEKIYSADN
ncbi:FAST kinase domain-containing protein 2, mitochondrial isoform X4 [Alligator mississippiensis]|uniref:FAST kinase domain-containing protein 2, mitochondrial isoform X4 n=1 Tax=Alligator mississippiensis TaxID=8496 RepID=UPI0028778D47|nr:FAST kinase domain-containing protein 2, mitochondrial isoform X4 [Alligator mississippiensis]